jgi:hypothetical protein
VISQQRNRERTLKTVSATSPFQLSAMAPKKIPWFNVELKRE